MKLLLKSLAILLTSPLWGGRKVGERSETDFRVGVRSTAPHPERYAFRPPHKGEVRLLLALLAAIPLSACGFHPLYATNGADGGASQIFTSIFVEPIAEDAGYEMRNSLIDLLDASGRRANPRYTLKVTLHDQLQGAALQNDASITRYNYTLTADYVLTDAATLKPVTSGEASTLTAYNVVASPYATLVAQKDARRRAGDELAERIRLDLGVFFSRAQK